MFLPLFLFIIAYNYRFVNKEIWPWKQIFYFFDMASTFFLYAIPIAISVLILSAIHWSLSEYAERVAIREAGEAKSYADSWYYQMNDKIKQADWCINDFKKDYDQRLSQLEKRIKELTAIKSAVNDNELERLI